MPDGPAQQVRDAEMARGGTDVSPDAIAWLYGYDAGELGANPPVDSHPGYLQVSRLHFHRCAQVGSNFWRHCKPVILHLLIDNILLNDIDQADGHLYIADKWQNSKQDNQYKRTNFKGVGHIDESRINE